MDFITISQLNHDILDGLTKIPADIDMVIGIPRSGLLVANLISLYMNKPMADLDGFINGRILASGKTKNTAADVKNVEEVKKVLIVDDSSNTGQAICEAKEKLEQTYPDIQKIYFVAYVNSRTKKIVDIWLRDVECRMFEWNYLHHIDLLRVCVDLDGILCEDPTAEQNDDGELYREFILNATPKLVPTRKIGWIVTSRLAKYKYETELWLKKSGIRYDHLIMLENMTAEERKKRGIHGWFKAKVFKSLPSALLFIESDPSQAKIIADYTHKDVFCPYSGDFYKENSIRSMMHIIKRKLFFYCRFVAKKMLPQKVYKRIADFKNRKKMK